MSYQYGQETINEDVASVAVGDIDNYNIDEGKNESKALLRKTPLEEVVPEKTKNWKIFFQRLSWYLCDSGSSAYITQVVSLFLPLYFKSVAGKDLEDATSVWGYTMSIAMAIIALSSPILGAIGDEYGKRKLMLAFFIVIGSISCCFIILVEPGQYIFCIVLTLITRIAYGIADSLYNSLLSFITDNVEEMNDTSSKGYVFGYIGGGSILAVTLVFFFALQQNIWVVRSQNVAVGVWWLTLSLPMFFLVPETATPVSTWRKPPTSNICTGCLCGVAEFIMTLLSCFKRLFNTFKEIYGYRQLFIFLVAFWFFNDGVSTIISMAVAFASDVKDSHGEHAVTQTHILIAVVAVELLCAPFTYIFIPIANYISAKRTILIGLVWYLLITVWAFFIGKYQFPGISYKMTSLIHFYIFAFMISVSQGPVQALSRSLFGALSPRSKSGEFFGFFGLSGKFAGIFGPLLFSFVTQIFKSGQAGILSVGVLFIIGFIILCFVNVEAGAEYAREAEKRIIEEQEQRKKETKVINP